MKNSRVTTPNQRKPEAQTFCDRSVLFLNHKLWIALGGKTGFQIGSKPVPLLLPGSIKDSIGTLDELLHHGRVGKGRDVAK